MDETKTINPLLDDALDFDTIYDRYFDRVFQFVLYRVGNREVAKDLASDIFLKIYKKLSTYRPEKGSFDVWLFSIAGNHVKDYYRKKESLPVASHRRCERCSRSRGKFGGNDRRARGNRVLAPRREKTEARRSTFNQL